MLPFSQASAAIAAAAASAAALAVAIIVADVCSSYPRSGSAWPSQHFGQELLPVLPLLQLLLLLLLLQMSVRCFCVLTQKTHAARSLLTVQRAVALSREAHLFSGKGVLVASHYFPWRGIPMR